MKKHEYSQSIKKRKIIVTIPNNEQIDRLMKNIKKNSNHVVINQKQTGKTINFDEKSELILKSGNN